ncbi:hypothetical protein KFK09_015397 [Dendrobium nobile]|uniref:Peptidase S8/S53 domain-containing protein n=1 Tax=Dendrobium nobile TaxID=94219 RepID=A0A8T3B616_DENNO|nr:hypothetical protein KFK09_015397 [Dendrobium nobile]
MMGQGLIIGVLDTSINPTHPSFKDTNMPPKPPITKWKGNCSYAGFPCNNKIIEAKAFFVGSHTSPEDTNGYGTHVASTTAGNFVKDANVLGMAKGDPASGIAPMAHLFIYKVCYPKVKCIGADLYAAIDQAMKDGWTLSRCLLLAIIMLLFIKIQFLGVLWQQYNMESFLSLWPEMMVNLL